jgi:transcriptional regulator with XRE-family HTH domain
MKLSFQSIARKSQKYQIIFFYFLCQIIQTGLCYLTSDDKCCKFLFMNIDILYHLLGQRIQQEREKAGISQSELARRLQMSRTSIVNIEAGRQRPPLHVIWQIAEQFGLEAFLIIPRQSEYEARIANNLSQKSILQEIEKAAAGNPQIEAKLKEFISDVKTSGQHNS